MVQASQRVKRRVLALVVLTTVLFAAVSAGTPVVGDHSVAAVTAGINLSTEAVDEAQRPAAPLADALQALDPERTGLWLVVIGLLFLITLGRLPSWSPGVARSGGSNRRGPPST